MLSFGLNSTTDKLLIFFFGKFLIIVVSFSYQSLKQQTATEKQLQMDTLTHTQSLRLLVNPLLIPPH